MRRKKDKQFHFKQFSVRHDRSGMKVGTDGTLLGAWTEVTEANRILDIGTGTGLIALMLAQRTQPHVKIEAIEIDAHACEDAVENFSASSWSDRIVLHSTSLQQFSATNKFDLIVSNPPFFQNSYKPATEKRTTARHTESLTFQELLTAAQNLLTEIGTLNIILPPTEGLQFISLAESFGFYPSRKWTFRTRPEKPIERLLLEFSRNQSAPEENEILLYSSDEHWSEAYQSLTRDFYLKL
jgi:tRNA1Val (adenine37-N6)-methyltransferase